MKDPDEFFENKVKGRVKGALVLDQAGNPEFEQRGKLKHYKIKLWLESENKEIKQVIYKLHPTYFNDIRETRNVENKFLLEISTYGNYYPVADVYIGKEHEVARQIVSLVDLLNESHPMEANNEAINQAIEDIRKN